MECQVRDIRLDEKLRFFNPRKKPPVAPAKEYHDLAAPEKSGVLRLPKVNFKPQQQQQQQPARPSDAKEREKDKTTKKRNNGTDKCNYPIFHAASLSYTVSSDKREHSIDTAQQVVSIVISKLVGRVLPRPHETMGINKLLLLENIKVAGSC